MKNIIIFSILGFLLTGCGVVHKNIDKQTLLNRNNSLNLIFSKMLFKSKEYPYFYTISSIAFKSQDANKKISEFKKNIELLCQARGGKITSIYDYANRVAKISIDENRDRCFLLRNEKYSVLNNICYLDNKTKTPLFIYGYNIKHKLVSIKKFSYHVDKRYINRYVCLPDKSNWNYYFEAAHKSYLEKKKEFYRKLEQEKIKQKKLEQQDSFRRF